MRDIIAPVNFSPNSNNAARYAADLAQATQSDLYLIYVLQLPVSAGEFPVNDYIFNDMQEAGAASLKQLWEELIKRTAARVNIFVHMEVGPVEHKIEEFCMGKKPFAVVMGATGNSIGSVLTGSNIGAAIRHLPYPLIVVPEKATFQTIRRIVLACDMEDVAAGVPANPSYLQELTEIFDASFEVAHFEYSGKVERSLGKYLVNHPADLLMVFPKKHNFFEFHKSHARKIALTSQVPVMSIHA
jgi:nucleotide-binding universal stress UspA family protein